MVNAAPKVCPRCGTQYEASATFCAKDGASLQVASATADPRIGQVLLGQFRIDEAIGSGGMGVVYRARQVAAGRDVAIKLVHPELSANRDAYLRFEREARICGALDHPNIVRAFLSGQLPDGSLYLVMELLQGRTLADLLRIEPVLGLPRAIHILTQVADGIAAAHERGIVHRDVKPENVFLVPKGRDSEQVKVLDFGIARSFGAEDNLTVAGLVLGTALYISPEAAAGGAADARSDVYSLGVLAYRVLAGVTPFDATAPAQLLLKHLHQPAPPLMAPRGAPPIPEPIAHVVMRALSKSPADRYEDADDFAQALRDAALESGVEWGRPKTGPFRLSAPAAPPAPSTSTAIGDEAEPPSRPSYLTMGAAFVVGAVAVVGFYFLWPHAPSGPSATQVRAEELKAAELALAGHRWDGPDGVRATTDSMLATHGDDADALRIRRDAAAVLVEEGDHARTEGRIDEARARYDAALGLLVGSDGIESRLAGLGQLEQGPRVEHIVVAPAAVVGEAVMLTATIAAADQPGDQPRFVILRDGHRAADPIPAVATATAGVYAASYTFQTAGTCGVEFRMGHGDAGFAFRINVVVAPVERPERVVPAGGGGGGGHITTQG